MPTERTPTLQRIARLSLIVLAAGLAIPVAAAIHFPAARGASSPLSEAVSGVVSPYANGMPASVVLGQSSFTTNTGGVTPTNFSAPQGVAVDSAGDVWTSDQGSHRVLEFRAPVYTAEPASIVLGQPNFYSSTASLTASGMENPLSLAFDPRGDLWVSDWGYCRVLEFVPPFSSDMGASVVVGQSSFTASTCGNNATHFAEPQGIAFDAAGDLFVASQLDNRVLEFPYPQTTGEAASAVLGQSTFTGSAGNTSAVNLSCPLGLAVSRSMVWVGDSPCGNSRVLGFPEPVSTGEAATVVLGAPSFTSPSPTSGLNITVNPNSMAVDPAGNLFVDDFDLNRIYEFTAPFTAFEAPSRVIGQHAFGGALGGTTQVNISAPRGVAIGPDGTIWETDLNNARYLGFVPSKFTAVFHETGLPAAAAWSVTVDGTTHYSSSSNVSAAAINGTHDWTIGQAPPGYHLTSNLSGVVTVNGTAATIPVAFAQNGSASSSTPLYEGLGIGVVVGAAAGIGAGIVLSRRGKGKSGTVTQWPGSPGPAAGGPATPPPSGSPPTGGSPPPGASG